MNLNKEIRAKIVDNAIAKSEHPKMRAKIADGLKKLAKLAHSQAVTIPDEIIALSPEVKKAFIRHQSSIEIYAPGFDRYRHFQSKDATNDSHARDRLAATIILDDPLLVPTFFGAVDVKKFPKVAQAAEKLLVEHRAANTYEDELRAKLNAIVATANTKDQLLKTWPESAKFIPPEVVKSRALVDTKTVKDVNEALGLK